MEYIVKLGKDTEYDDYLLMIENHELDDMGKEAQNILGTYKRLYPESEITRVTMVINKRGE